MYHLMYGDLARARMAERNGTETDQGVRRRSLRVAMEARRAERRQRRR
jgi:hypothetical protein